ncbi:MAG: DUF3987 domain-containing protein [Pasteurella sp.]|nr:DUF3987 domain-containing protein [Pasteurella sp.]
MTNNFDYTEIMVTPKRYNYPANNIGILGSVIKTIADSIKADDAMVGQAVLSTLAGACQKSFKVRYFVEVGIKPLSLFTLTIASSGDKKSTIAEKCSQPLIDLQEKLYNQYNIEKNQYKKQVKECQDNEVITKPSNPIFMISSGTTEGIVDVVADNGYCVCFVDELATLLGGYSFKNENVQKFIGTCSSLWSGMNATDVRRGEKENRIITGTLTLALFGQYVVAQNILNDEMWRHQGIFNRFLICEPKKTSANYRMMGESINLDEIPIYQRYKDIISEIFSIEKEHIIYTDEQAEYLLNEFYNDLENQAYNDELNAGYLARATEQVGRLSALLAIFEYFYHNVNNAQSDNLSIVINADNVKSAIYLMNYYISEYKRLTNGQTESEIRRMALDLFAEMRTNISKWQNNEIGFISRTTVTKILNHNQSKRDKERMRAFDLLLANGYLKEVLYKDSNNRNQVKYAINPNPPI